MTERLRLFLIEDDDDIALLIRNCLERAGHLLRHCRTGAEALTLLEHETFDLVLVDQCLPDLSGTELLAALSRAKIVLATLMVTAHGDEDLARRVLQAGALDYVVKDSALTFLADLPRRVEEAVARYRLQQTNHLLLAALESAGDGIMVTDLQGTLVHVNRALEQMSGYSRREMLGQTPRLFKSDRQAPEFYARLWQRVLAREVWQGELTNRCKDGRLIEVSLTVSPVVDTQGQFTHLVGILRDVSERRHLERQLAQAQKNQSVGTLAGGVAHEFNNLLTGIAGYASLALLEADLRPPAREFIEQVETLAHRAGRLTRQLLTYARRPDLARRPTVIADLIASTADLLRTSLFLEAALDFPEQAVAENLLVSADVNQFQRALVNLALNARDACVLRDPTSREAPVQFRLRHCLLTDERRGFPKNVPAGDYVLIEVIDHGSGMSPEVLGQAMDPFFTTKEVGQGTGLGLPVVFGIIQAHQGHLTLESTLGEGTRVGLYLPRLFREPISPVS